MCMKATLETFLDMIIFITFSLLSLAVYPLQIRDLLQTKLYKCNNCSTAQSIELDPGTEGSLHFQATTQLRSIHRGIMLAIQQAQTQRVSVPKNVLDLFRQITLILNPVQQGANAQMPHHMHHRPSPGPTQLPSYPPGILPGQRFGQAAMPPQGPRGQYTGFRPHPALAPGQGVGPARGPLSMHIPMHELHKRMQQQQQQQHAAISRLPDGTPTGFTGNNTAHRQKMQAIKGKQEEEEDQILNEEEEDGDEGEIRDTFMEYKPMKLTIGHTHPDPVVETASLGAVEPPDITYELTAKKELVDEARLSALQLEAVVYACQRHEQRLPSGARGGFFIGDGAGVGKGRAVAGLILENWRKGRHQHIWISIGADLKLDAQRDLHDVGASDIPVHALNKLPYGKLAGHKINVRAGVIFLTYASLISSSDRGMSRFKQLVEWCGPEFDGLIIFDESHKAKNLVPEAGSRPTQIGLKVQQIQKDLPGARIVYCSATGASEPRNMGYMVRLGLWGEGHVGFPDFPKFLEAVAGKHGTASGGNMAGLELVAMDMKAQGMYVCRTLSFASAEFETLSIELEEPIASQYKEASKAWNEIYREFMYAEEKFQEAAGLKENADSMARVLNNSTDDDDDDDGVDDNGKATGVDNTGSGAVSTVTGGPSGRTGRGGGSSQFGNSNTMMWRSFWSAHQRFFRHMCIAAKVPAAVRMAQQVLLDDKCVVIGLQSTGEARTNDVIAEKGEELDDFVSGPKELLSRLIDHQYPVPAHPDEEDDSDGSDSDAAGDESFENERITEAAAKGALMAREAAARRTQRNHVRYKEYESDEDIGATTSEDEESDEEESRDEDSDGSQEDAASNADATDATDADNEGNDEESDPEEEEESSDEDNPMYVSKKRQKKKEEDEAKLSPEERERRASAEGLLRETKDKILAMRHEALERKRRLKELVSSLDLPTNPLDDLIDRLGGPTMVAEMTGRKSRLVRDMETGTVRFEPRNASGVEKGATLEMINVHERELFLDGAKLVAVISEAASAGISLHADRRVPNQRRRVHITLELPWSADKAIQQFGRSHRANQAHGPQYRLIFTPLGGEKRFAAAVARRLESLGALTQGDRRAGPSLAEFNYESTWGQRALRLTYNMLLGDVMVPPALVPSECRPGPHGAAPLRTLPAFIGHSRALLLNAGLLRLNKERASPLHMNDFLTEVDGAPYKIGTIEDKEKADVPRFLNRLLGLDPESQSQLFDFYQSTLDDMLEHARRDGTFDEGILDLKAHSIQVDGEGQILYQDPISKASTLMYAIKIDRGLPWEYAEEILKEHFSNAEEKIENEMGDTTPKEGESKEGDTKAVGEKRGRSSNGVIDAKEEKTKSDDDKDDKKSSRKRIKLEDKDEKNNDAAADNNGVVATSDKDDEKPSLIKSEGGGKENTLEHGSGFYRTKEEGLGNRIYIMLALQVPESKPQSYIIYRPGTGKARKPFLQSAMRDKYLPLTLEEAKPLWIKAHTASGVPSKEGKSSTRHRTMHILSGAVMQSWNTVHKSMLRYVKTKERRMKVMRIATTGETSQRLVGMYVPEDTVESIVRDLKTKHEETLEKQSVQEMERKANAERIKEEETKKEEKKAKEKLRKEKRSGDGKKEDLVRKGDDASVIPDEKGVVDGGRRMTRSSSAAVVTINRQ